MLRLPILKTYKLFIGGQFLRTESGRFYQLKNKKNLVLANVCLSSRKDYKNAVVSARQAFSSWSQKSAFNRGQILYRIAEMLEGRKEQFINELVLQGITLKKSREELDLSIDALVYYAGWCDKYQALFSSVNPVASSHFNFSVPEPTGLVSVIAPTETGVLGLISVLAPIIAGGNTCVVLASEKLPLCAITFAEVIATSDLPIGVINILTGSTAELYSHFSSHLDVNAIVYCGNNPKEQKTIMQNCALNVKRFFNWHKDWKKSENRNPYLILDLQEIKTTWHPIETIGNNGNKY